MRFFAKNGILIYLLITVLFKFGRLVPKSVPTYLFYAMMGIGIVLLILYFPRIYNRKTLKVFAVFHLVNLLNFVYLLAFDMGSQESWLYFLAKWSTSNLIILGLLLNYNNYRAWLEKYFGYLILFVLIAAYLFNPFDADELRLGMGFNSNDTGLFGALGIFWIISFRENWNKNLLFVALLIAFSFVLFASGSRAAILGLAIVLMFSFSFRIRSILLVGVIGVTLLVVTGQNYTTGLNRLEESENVFTGRDEVFEKGLASINDAPLTGNGLDKTAWTNPKFWSNPTQAMGPHNTYLSIAIAYGLIFGILFILILLFFLRKAYRLYRFTYDKTFKFSYRLLVLTLILGYFESLIVGTNEFISLFFWINVGIVAYAYQYNCIQANGQGNR